MQEKKMDTERKKDQSEGRGTHWISSRCKRDGLHVMVGDNLQRDKKVKTNGGRERDRKTAREGKK